MRLLKEIDLTAETAQLRLVMKLRDKHDPRYQEALDSLHLMLAKKTLEYYCDDGYDAFFLRHQRDYTTDDGYHMEVRGHEMTVSTATPCGVIKGTGSTWDYMTDDLSVSAKPPQMDRTEYAAVKRRMEKLQDSERVLYPFHPLHRLGNGCFDTTICMYNAHTLVKNAEYQGGSR